jgi:probable F420-dependent oxidoreductase
MKVGVFYFATDYSIEVTTLATKVEELGFESLWLPEHPIIPVHQGQLPDGYFKDGILPKYYFDVVDQFVALGAAAAVTSTLKIATGITLVPERNPLLLAKEVATVDLISGGRFLFGIGAGWLKEETEIMGGNFPRRWSQTRESILAMKQLWTTVESEFHGEFYDFPPVYSFPRPVQRPHPPIHLGGSAKNVFKRVVEYGDGWMPALGGPEVILEGRRELDRLCEEVGRDSSSIEITAFHEPADRELIKKLEEAGTDRVILELGTIKTDEALAQLESHAEAVL